MNKEQANMLSVIASLFILVGLILMFTSVKFGNALSSQWLMNAGGMADTSEFEMVSQTYINNFVIIGSLLVGAGLVTGLFTFITQFLYGKNKVAESNEDKNI